MRGPARTRADHPTLNPEGRAAAISCVQDSIRPDAWYIDGMTPIARMRAVVLDCPDPRALADFYRELVGGDITHADDEWVNLRDGGAVLLSFQLVPDFRAPDWPAGDPPQQFHLDVTVDDIEDAERGVLERGATKHAVQPGEEEEDGNFRVYLDPVGHPFCLCWD